MRHTPIQILHRHLQRLIKATMHQAPDMANPAAKGIHMLPAPTRREPLPMLHRAAHRDTQLERARGVLVGGRPVGLDHDGRRRADAAAEDLPGRPAGAGGGVAGEHLHVPAGHDGDDVEDAPAGGADVGLD
jgi:hypothetical protein